MADEKSIFSAFSTTSSAPTEAATAAPAPSPSADTGGGGSIFSAFSSSPKPAATPAPSMSFAEPEAHTGSIFSAFSGEQSPSQTDVPRETKPVSPDDPWYKKTWNFLNEPLFDSNSAKKYLGWDVDHWSGWGKGLFDLASGLTSPLSVGLAVGTFGSSALFESGGVAALKAAGVAADEISEVVKGSEIMSQAYKMGKTADEAYAIMADKGLNASKIANNLQLLADKGISAEQVIATGIVRRTGGAMLRQMGVGPATADQVSNWVQFAVDAGFTAQNAYAAVMMSPQALDAVREGDFETAKRLAIDALGTGAFAALGGHAMFKHAGELMSKGEIAAGINVKPSDENVKLLREFEQRDRDLIVSGVNEKNWEQAERNHPEAPKPDKDWIAGGSSRFDLGARFFRETNGNENNRMAFWHDAVAEAAGRPERVSQQEMLTAQASEINSRAGLDLLKEKHDFIKNNSLRLGDLRVPDKAEKLFDFQDSNLHSLAFQLEDFVGSRGLQDDPVVRIAMRKAGEMLSRARNKAANGDHQAATYYQDDALNNLHVALSYLGDEHARGAFAAKNLPEGVTVKRAPDFERLGEHIVSVDGKEHRIYRDPENGLWYEHVPDKHFSQTFIGFNKNEAIEKIVSRYRSSDMPQASVIDPSTGKISGEHVAQEQDYFAKAKQELGEKASVSDVLKRAQELKEADQKSAASPNHPVDRLIADIRAGVVYHGTTKTQAESIRRSGFEGMSVNKIVQNVARELGLKTSDLSQEQKEQLGSMALSYSRQLGGFSVSHSKEVANRWAGKGGEIASRVRAILTNSDRMQEFPDIGEPEIVQGMLTDEGKKSTGYRNALRHAENVEKAIKNGELTKDQAYAELSGTYHDIRLKSGQVEVREKPAERVGSGKDRRVIERPTQTDWKIYWNYRFSQVRQELAAARESGDNAAIEAAQKRFDDVKSQMNKPQAKAAPADLPQAARTAEGKIKLGADVGSLGKILSSNLYGNDVAHVVTKEMIQNAMDAARTSDVKQVHVDLDYKNNAVQVKDFGKGMTRKELETVFTDIGSSGKRETEGMAGGFGLGNVMPLMASKKMEVTSIVNENGKLMQYTFTSTPEKLLNEGVEVKEKVLSSFIPKFLNTDKGPHTGVTVKAFLPEGQDMWGAENFIRNSNRSISRPADLVLTKDNKPYELASYGDKKISFSGKPVLTQKLTGADVDLHVTNEKGPVSGFFPTLNVEIHNNGVFQFNDSVGAPEGVRDLPTRVAVDVKSTVPEGDPNYPFEANRERLRGKLSEEIRKLVEEKVIKPAVQHDLNAVSEAYNRMPKIEGTNMFVFDTGGRMTPEELKTVTSHPAVKEIASKLGSLLHGAMMLAKSPDAFGASFGKKIHRFGLVFSDKLHGVYVPNPGKEEVTVFVNPFSFKKGSTPLQVASLVWHTAQHELTHDIAKGHNENFTITLARMSHALGDMGVHAALELEKAYDPKQTGTIRPDLAEPLRIYEESRKRPEVTRDIFGGEASRSGEQPSGSQGASASVPAGGKSPLPEITEENGQKFHQAESTVRPYHFLAETGKPQVDPQKVNQFKAMIDAKQDLPAAEIVRDENGRVLSAKGHEQVVAAMEKGVDRVPVVIKRRVSSDDPAVVQENHIRDLVKAGNLKSKPKAYVDQLLSALNPNNLTDAQKEYAKRIGKHEDETLVKAQNAGALGEGVANHVSRIWKNPDDNEIVNRFRSLHDSPNFAITSGMAKHRVFQSTLEGILKGYELDNPDMIALAAHNGNEFGRIVANRQVIDRLMSKGVRAADGSPATVVAGKGHQVEGDEGENPAIILNTLNARSVRIPDSQIESFVKNGQLDGMIRRGQIIKVGERPAPKEKGQPIPVYAWTTHKYVNLDHPALRAWTTPAHDFDGNPIHIKGDVMVHPEFADYLTKRLGKEQSVIQKIPGLKQVLRAGAEAKGLLLFGSPFHFFQEGLRAIMTGISPIGNEKFNVNDPIHLLAAEKGVWENKDYKGVAAFQEGLAGHSKILSKVPGVAQIQSWYQDMLFDRYIPGLKLRAFKNLYDRYQQAYPEWKADAVRTKDGRVHYLPDSQIKKFASENPDSFVINSKAASAAAADTNERFGGIAYKRMGRSVATMDLARLVALAPDWLESEMRFMARMFGEEGKIARRDVARMAIGLWGVSRVLNYLVSGHPHNEAPFGVVVKDDEGRDKVYSVRTLPTDMMHAVNDPSGFMKGRVAPLVRSGVETYTGRDEFGRKIPEHGAYVSLLRNISPIPAQTFVKAATGETPDVTNKDQFIKGLGATVFPYRTEGQKKAAELASSHSEAGPVDDAKLKRHQMLIEFENRVRSGQIPTTDVYGMVEEGKLSIDEAKQIIKTVNETQGLDPEMARLYAHVSRLPLKDVLDVWDLATPKEHAVLAKLLLKKKNAYVRKAAKDMSAAERMSDPVYKRIRQMFPQDQPF